MGNTGVLTDERVTLTTSTGRIVHLTPMDTNALCAFEERTGLVFGALMASLGVAGMEHWSLRITRMFLQACAMDGTTLESMGELIDDIGLEGIGAAVNQLITLARTRG